MYVCARLLSGRMVGPRRRWYDAPQREKPYADEWCTYLEMLGPAGGCTGHRVRGRLVFSHPDAIPRQVTKHHLAQQDTYHMMRSLCKQILRNTCPQWSAPVEVWRQLIRPTWQHKMQRAGVGAVQQLAAPNFHRVLDHLMDAMRAHYRVPAEWNCNMGVELDKRNNKSGCAGIRLLNILDCMGKARFASIGRSKVYGCSRDYAYAYCEGKSRMAP